MITLKGLRVPHARYVAAYNRLKSAIEWSGSEGICIPLLGPTRTGKTDILNKLRNEYSGKGVGAADFFSATGFAGGAIRPKPNDAELYAAILRAANASVGVKERLSTLQDRAQSVVARNGIKVIALDECSHCIEPGANLSRRAAADHFKHMVDTTKSVLILSGLPKFQSLIDQNEQLQSRSMATIELHPYRWHDVEDRDEFVEVIFAIFEFIKEKGVALDLDTVDMTRRLYAASGGRVGLIVNSMETALRAVQSERRLSFADLERGFSARMQNKALSSLVFAQETPTDEDLARAYAKVMSDAGLPLPAPLDSGELSAFSETRKNGAAA